MIAVLNSPANKHLRIPSCRRTHQRSSAQALLLLWTALICCSPVEARQAPRSLLQQDAPTECNCPTAVHTAAIAVPTCLGTLLIVSLIWVYLLHRQANNKRQTTLHAYQLGATLNRLAVETVLGDIPGGQPSLLKPGMDSNPGVQPNTLPRTRDELFHSIPGVNPRRISMGQNNPVRRRSINLVHAPNTALSSNTAPSCDTLYLDPATVASPGEGIDVTRQDILAASLDATSRSTEQLEFISILGQGTYGSVYKASWKGIVVACKVMVLTGGEKREKMAVMEAAISSSLSHPNIVQTYTFSVKALNNQAVERNSNMSLATSISPHPRGITPCPVLDAERISTATHESNRASNSAHTQHTVRSIARTPQAESRNTPGSASRDSGPLPNVSAPLHHPSVLELQHSHGLHRPPSRLRRHESLTGLMMAQRLAVHRQTSMTGLPGSPGAPPGLTPEDAGVDKQDISQRIFARPSLDVRPRRTPTRAFSEKQLVRAAAAGEKTGLGSAPSPRLSMCVSVVVPGGSRGLVSVPGRANVQGAAGLGGGGGDPEGEVEGLGSWEVRLIQEFCEAGTLRDLLDKGGFAGTDGVFNFQAMLDTAMDVARAMEHLHTQHIVHSDLKPRNVLLKANPLASRGFIAKVADFGLSVRLSQDTGHVNNVFQGTLSHMAPEVLLHGQLGKPVDVYAFGMVLWEMYTGERAYRGMSKSALIEALTRLGLRPTFPSHAPPSLVNLASQCWMAAPGARPSFTEVLQHLQDISSSLANTLDTPIPSTERVPSSTANNTTPFVNVSPRGGSGRFGGYAATFGTSPTMGSVSAAGIKRNSSTCGLGTPGVGVGGTSPHGSPGLLDPGPSSRASISGSGLRIVVGFVGAATTASGPPSATLVQGSSSLARMSIGPMLSPTRSNTGREWVPPPRMSMVMEAMSQGGSLAVGGEQLQLSTSGEMATVSRGGGGGGDQMQEDDGLAEVQPVSPQKQSYPHNIMHQHSMSPGVSMRPSLLGPGIGQPGHGPAHQLALQRSGSSNAVFSSMLSSRQHSLNSMARQTSGRHFNFDAGATWSDSRPASGHNQALPRQLGYEDRMHSDPSLLTTHVSRPGSVVMSRGSLALGSVSERNSLEGHLESAASLPGADDTANHQPNHQPNNHQHIMIDPQPLANPTASAALPKMAGAGMSRSLAPRRSKSQGVSLAAARQQPGMDVALSSALYAQPHALLQDDSELPKDVGAETLDTENLDNLNLGHDPVQDLGPDGHVHHQDSQPASISSTASMTHGRRLSGSLASVVAPMSLAQGLGPGPAESTAASPHFAVLTGPLADQHPSVSGQGQLTLLQRPPSGRKGLSRSHLTRTVSANASSGVMATCMRSSSLSREDGVSSRGVSFSMPYSAGVVDAEVVGSGVTGQKGTAAAAAAGARGVAGALEGQSKEEIWIERGLHPVTAHVGWGRAVPGGDMPREEDRHIIIGEEVHGTDMSMWASSELQLPHLMPHRSHQEQHAHNMSHVPQSQYAQGGTLSPRNSDYALDMLMTSLDGQPVANDHMLQSTGLAGVVPATPAYQMFVSCSNVISGKLPQLDVQASGGFTGMGAVAAAAASAFDQDAESQSSHYLERSDDSTTSDRPMHADSETDDVQVWQAGPTSPREPLPPRTRSVKSMHSKERSNSRKSRSRNAKNHAQEAFELASRSTEHRRAQGFSDSSNGDGRSNSEGGEEVKDVGPSQQVQALPSPMSTMMATMNVWARHSGSGFATPSGSGAWQCSVPSIPPSKGSSRHASASGLGPAASCRHSSNIALPGSTDNTPGSGALLPPLSMVSISGAIPDRSNNGTWEGGSVVRLVQEDNSGILPELSGPPSLHSAIQALHGHVVAPGSGSPSAHPSLGLRYINDTVAECSDEGLSTGRLEAKLVGALSPLGSSSGGGRGAAGMLSPLNLVGYPSQTLMALQGSVGSGSGASGMAAAAGIGGDVTIGSEAQGKGSGTGTGRLSRQSSSASTRPRDQIPRG